METTPQGQARAARLLARTLTAIERYDTDYDRRYRLVFIAVAYALTAGMEAGIGIDPSTPGWHVLYIELPTGQVSWHMPEHVADWDGHSTEQKYARCREYTASQGE